MGTMSSTCKFQYIFQKNIQCIWWCTTLSNDLRQPQWPSFFKALGWGVGGVAHATRPPPPSVASRLRCAQLVAPNIFMTQLFPPPPPFSLEMTPISLGRWYQRSWSWLNSEISSMEIRLQSHYFMEKIRRGYRGRQERQVCVCGVFFGEPNPAMVRWVVGLILHGGPISYFSFQPVLHDWCNKGRGMCYPVCGMIHIK